MATYRIEIRSAPRHGEHWQVEAESVEDAALVAVRRISRLTRPVHVSAQRYTGDKGLSGLFQCWRAVGGLREVPIGPSFHVSEVL